MATARRFGLKLRPGTPLKRPVGCGTCKQTGYVGRIGVYEAVRVDDAVRRLIVQEADEEAISQAALKPAGGLAASALAAVEAGLTTIEEAIRVTRQDAGADLGGV